MGGSGRIKLQRMDDWRWRIPREGRMRTEAILYVAAGLVEDLKRDASLEQLVNVASLPGIVGPAMAMPDIHQGYGFPIGGVAAFDVATGVVSPGGVGYDINCGVRLLRTRCGREDLAGRIPQLIQALARNIPCGVGSRRSDLKLKDKDLDAVLTRGVGWTVARGLASAADADHVESSGCIQGADPDRISPHAKERGRAQLGTLGSGNHFIEIGFVDRIDNAGVAEGFGLEQDQITVMIHTGSRGLGHQVCDDHLRSMANAARRHGIELPDRQLACAPIDSPEGRGYLAAMAGAANFAFANRQLITHWVRETFERVLGNSAAELGLGTVYDVTHNMAKLEDHQFEGRTRRLCVHRKGATRAFGPGQLDLPPDYRALGQPVLIPGDMGRCSYVLVGTERAMEATFGSTCHGAGRLLSRHQAKKRARGRSIAAELRQAGIEVHGASRNTLDEEIPEAYKDVEEVVEVVHRAGIAGKVARLKPLGVVKG
jgi:tRNA-splicing ligase RtcB